ncbi:MAG: ABC transporter permease, partial [Chloroflexota bacterium]
MTQYIFRRFLQGIPTFFGITLFAFILMLIAPGDPVSLITFNPSSGDTETVDRMRRQLGLDKPPIQQYLYWLIGNDWTQYDSDGDGVDDSPGTRQGLLRGDLGDSISQQRPVSELIIQRIPATLRLTVSALIIGYGVGILLGILAAVFHRTWIDQVV